MPSARDLAAPTFASLPPDIRVVARPTTGLEGLLEAELLRAGHTVDRLSKRQLVVSPADGSILTDPPRLADDVFVVAADAPDPGPRRCALVAIASGLDPAETLLGRLPPSPTLAVSASFVGRRTYSRYDVEDAVGRTLSRLRLGHYVSRRGGARPPLDAAQWRVTLDGHRMLVGPRPFLAPLHRRPWRTGTVLGSLHPPVAAAMAALARIERRHAVLDPCCGAGTILVEAHARQPAAELHGRDIDPDAVSTARSNAVGVSIRWDVGEATDTGFAARSVDRIVTNPPWGIRRRAGDLDAALREWHRILRSDGLLVALLDEPQAPVLAAHPNWEVVHTYPVSVAGRHPRITVAGAR